MSRAVPHKPTSHDLHESWVWAMDRIWGLYPRMCFFANLDNTIVCFGGFAPSRKKADNDEMFTIVNR